MTPPAGRQTRTAVALASAWLGAWLAEQGGEAPRADVIRHGTAAGHTVDALTRARARLSIDVRNEGYPRRTLWSLVGAASTQPTPTTVAVPAACPHCGGALQVTVTAPTAAPTAPAGPAGGPDGTTPPTTTTGRHHP